MNDESLSFKDKMVSLLVGLALTATVIELGFQVMAPVSSGFNNESDEYPSNPRGYFDALQSKNGDAVFGIPIEFDPETQARIGTPLKPEAAVRILGLGDSQGMGQGVRFEHTAYEQLSVLLGNQGINARVLNRSVRGYDIEEVVARAKAELGQNNTIELTVYWLVLDDFGLDIQRETQRPPSMSATVRYFAHAYDQWVVSQRTIDAYTNAFKGDSLKRGTDAMVELNSVVRAHGGTLVIAIMPLLYDFDTYPFGSIHAELNAACTTHALTCVDLLPALSTEPASSLWVHPIDHHPNETAHRLIATELASRIASSTALKPLTDP